MEEGDKVEKDEQKENSLGINKGGLQFFFMTGVHFFGTHFSYKVRKLITFFLFRQ